MSAPNTRRVQEQTDLLLKAMLEEFRLDDDQFLQWLSYFFEGIDGMRVFLGDRTWLTGEQLLEKARDILNERLEKGGW